MPTSEPALLHLALEIGDVNERHADSGPSSYSSADS